MFNLKYVFIFLYFFFISCSSPHPIDGSNEQFAQKAISIAYSSSQDLNSYDTQSHSVPLIVYQLNERNTFDSLSKSKAGIVKLLEAKKFDTSVMGVTKHYVLPNETKELLLNRATKTVWIALVVGCYDIQPKQSIVMYKVPSYNNLKFWDSEESQKFLKINIYLDKSSIEKRQE